jgi:hypothetical protein
MKLLPYMVNVSNNSKLTKDLTQALENKLSPPEKVALLEWLELVEEKQRPHKAFKEMFKF